VSKLAAVIPLVPAWRVDKTFTYAIPEELEASVEIGSLVRVPFGHRKVRGVVVELADGDAGELEAILKLVFPAPVAPQPMPQVLDWIARRYTTPRGVVFDRVVPPRVRVTARRVELPIPKVSGLLGSYENGDSLLTAISNGIEGTWCLQTLPSHDRGALLVELVSAAVGSGSALVAVPEVRYGSNVIDRLLVAFPGAARVDSSAGDQERSKGWAALGAGTRLGLGGRGAVLGPARELRLIVVDDEPHTSFKEDRSPRFDARRVAMERARLSGAVCVFAGNALSVESGWGAMKGDLGWVAPARAALKSARPNVELTEPEGPSISKYLHQAVNETLRRGEGVGLLVPQSGYARALWCSSCRRSIRCPRCEAGVIYERSGRAVRCPRCAWSGTAPDVCPSCGSTEFRYLGAGSERLEEQLAHTFPRSRVVRMDPTILAETEGKIPAGDIYVTTWIGTKPELRPEVKLVGVLDVDALIRRPDFRAAENAYLAVVEMAGWAGPHSEGGRLVLQTAEPGHHAVQAVVRADHGFFLKREVELRRELGYPPFSELVKLRSGGAASTEVLERACAGARAAGARVLGPVPVRTNQGAAAEVLLKCPDASRVAEALRVILPDVPQGTYLRVDVDPR
jgi:primosomal protein N' (replication factor Y)